MLNLFFIIFFNWNQYIFIIISIFIIIVSNKKKLMPLLSKNNKKFYTYSFHLNIILMVSFILKLKKYSIKSVFHAGQFIFIKKIIIIFLSTKP